MGAGRLWIRNSIANFCAFDTVLRGSLCDPHRPILVAAPGPSLELCVPVINECRSLFDLWALPSSSLFLRDAGIRADLLVMTDPGYYAMHHLDASGIRAPIAMPLSAARGAWHRPPVRPYLLAQPTPFEKALLEAGGVPAPLVAPHGTVAATAIDLALRHTSAPVIVAGLDMCTRDVAMHARPNAFDLLLHLRSSRLTPHTSLLFHRAVAQGSERSRGAPGTRSSPSLRTYAGWFDGPDADRSGRLFRLLPSAVGLRGFSGLDPDALRRLLRSQPSSREGSRFSPQEGYPARHERTRIVQSLLEAWKSSLAAAQESICRSAEPAQLELSSLPLTLAYYIEPQLLLEARRKSRRGDLASARATAEEMFRGCIDCLGEQAEKSRAGA
jgi:hypothetical protein